MLHIKIENNGWKQGKCLQISESKEPFEKIGLYVLISQDCDIVNEDLQKESYVEFLFMEEIPSISKMHSHSQNPRVLHLEIPDKKLSINAVHPPVILAREKLVDLMPHETSSIEGKNRDVLVAWKVNRYKRPAFPGSFNNRIKAAKKQLIKILTNESIKEDIIGVFIRLHDESELPESEPYKIEVYILIDGEGVEQNSLIFDELFEKIYDILTECTLEINAEKSGVYSTKDISVYEYSKLKKMDFEFLSYASEPQGKVAPDKYL